MRFVAVRVRLSGTLQISWTAIGYTIFCLILWIELNINFSEYDYICIYIYIWV